MSAAAFPLQVTGQPSSTLGGEMPGSGCAGSIIRAAIVGSKAAWGKEIMCCTEPGCTLGVCFQCLNSGARLQSSATRSPVQADTKAAGGLAPSWPNLPAVLQHLPAQLAAHCLRALPLPKPTHSSPGGFPRGLGPNPSRQALGQLRTRPHTLCLTQTKAAGLTCPTGHC